MGWPRKGVQSFAKNDWYGTVKTPLKLSDFREIDRLSAKCKPARDTTQLSRFLIAHRGGKMTF